MIAQPITYSATSKTLVDHWSKRPAAKRKTDYWATDAIKPLRVEVKKFYRTAQNYECSYCRNNLRVRNASVWDAEHIVARDSRPEFMFEPRNLCIACRDCNGFKGTANVLKNPKCKKYPKKSDAFYVMHPHYDNYDDHIDKHPNGRFYFPHSDKGAFTIEKCKLLRFAYKTHGYDPAIAQAPQALDFVDRIAKISDHGQRMNLLNQLLLQAWVDMRGVYHSPVPKRKK